MKFIIGLFLTLYSGCSTVSFGKAGLLVPERTEKSKFYHIKKSNAPLVEGRSCRKVAIVVPFAWDALSASGAVRDAIEKLNDSSVVGLADVELSYVTKNIVPFYYERCWIAKGVPAVAK